MMNITLLEHSIPDDDPLVRKLGRAGVRFLGQIIVRAIVKAIEGKDPEAGRILGLIIAWARRRAQHGHVEAVAGGEIKDVKRAELYLGELKLVAEAAEALPEAARPSNARFWLQGDRLFSDREIHPVTLITEDGYLVCGGLCPEAARVFAELLGGRLVEQPPAYLIEDEDPLTAPRDPSEGWEALP